jgi:hypothetical protein
MEGGREKDPLLLQILIEALTKPGGVVLDANASTGLALHSYLIAFSCFSTLLAFSLLFEIVGASIHACRRSGRHLVAFESDPFIFEAVLTPLQDAAPSASTAVPSTEATLFDEDEVPIRQVAKRNRLSK